MRKLGRPEVERLDRADRQDRRHVDLLHVTATYPYFISPDSLHARLGDQLYRAEAIMLKITGLDELTKSMKELQAAISEMDGEIGMVNFDPNDPESIEQAIQAANRAIDARVARYSRNKMVVDLAEDLKENTRSSILERAAAARLEGNEDE